MASAVVVLVVSIGFEAGESGAGGFDTVPILVNMGVNISIAAIITISDSAISVIGRIGFLLLD
jgi:hypothetical protein